MQKYQKYKTTNIKWADQIPADWSEIPLRKVFEDVKTLNKNGDTIRMLSLVKDIGIIPYEVDDEKIHFVGNTSLAGAKYAILNKDVRNISEELTRSIKHIDLSTVPTFEEEFAMSTYFPEQKQ